MGESLYGDPALCIRELVQNALHALELRELRLKVQDTGDTLRDPVDSLGKDEQLHVELTWALMRVQDTISFEYSTMALA